MTKHGKPAKKSRVKADKDATAAEKAIVKEDGEEAVAKAVEYGTKEGTTAVEKIETVEGEVGEVAESIEVVKKPTEEVKEVWIDP